MEADAQSISMVAAAYVYATLAPVAPRGKGATHGVALRLAVGVLPGLAVLALTWGSDRMEGEVALLAALAAVVGAGGMWAHGAIRSAAGWLSVQIGVLLVLAGLTAWIGSADMPESVAALAVVVAGAIVAVEWGGAFVGRAIRPFSDALYNTKPDSDGVLPARGLPKGFADGGATIGRWERLLIFLFVLADAPTAIGFLVTAKSILRFGEVKGDARRPDDDAPHKQAEYILIGTLMSFGFALVASAVTRLALHALAPDLLVALSIG